MSISITSNIYYFRRHHTQYTYFCRWAPCLDAAQQACRGVLPHAEKHQRRGDDEGVEPVPGVADKGEVPVRVYL